MITKPHNTLISVLADTLIEKQVNTNAVAESLKIICQSFSFDCGMVYEIDQYNCLNLKERYTVCPMELSEEFAIEDISPDHRRRLAEESMTYIRGDSMPFEHELLGAFSAASAAIISVVDENTRIYGLLVFLNKTPRAPLADFELETLSVLLSMLGRYAEIRMYQHKLSFARTSLESILDNTGIDIYVNDFITHDILYVNKSMAAPYGGISQFMGHKCWEVLFPEQSGQCEFCPQKKLIDENGEPTKTYIWDYQRSFDGSWFRVFSSAFRWVDGRLAHVVSSADITDNKRNEELIEYMASYDSLTRLPNRRMLIKECNTRINTAKASDRWYLMFFDIDGFKAINDNLGHDAGDEFLVQLGEFFSDIPMLKNAIYRNGGDEFVAVLARGLTEVNIKNLTNFIHNRFKKPWNLKRGPVFCGTSIGVACYPDDGLTSEALLHAADQAMYHIKRSGGGGTMLARQDTDSASD